MKLLVIGSGGATHNLGEIGPGETLPKWAADFDTWLDARARAGDAKALMEYRKVAPDAVRNHPSEDHYLPILVALGAAGENAKGKTHKDKVFIHALRDIKPGEELTYNYGIVLDEPHTAKLKKLWACKCGARNCTGTMLQPKR